MRLLNRPLAFILAVALAAASVILIIEVIGYAVNSRPVIVHWTTWYHWARGTQWDALVIRIWSAILILIGVILLALELKPRRITRLRLHSDNQATDAALTRSGLAGTLRTAATGIDGISSADVTVRRRRAIVAAKSAARGRAAADPLRQPVTQAVLDRLNSLGLQHPPRLKVRVLTRRR
jgi:hypothetical protein